MLRFFWVLLFANGVFFSSPATEFDLTEAIITEFKLSMYDLQDLFDERATATKEAYLKLSFEDKVIVTHTLVLILILFLVSHRKIWKENWGIHLNTQKNIYQNSAIFPMS